MLEVNLRILADQPITNIIKLFKFQFIGSEFDVKPLFDVLDHYGSEDLAAIFSNKET